MPGKPNTKVKVLLSHIQHFGTPWTVARQAHLSMKFSRQNTGVGCRVLLQGIFLTQGSNPRLLCLLRWQAGSLYQCHLGSNVIPGKQPDNAIQSSLVIPPDNTKPFA